MAESASKQQVLAAIEAERADWEALVGEVGLERMERPGVEGEWTFKDVAAHLTGWRSRTIDRLEAHLRGQPEPATPWPSRLETDDEINAWIHARHRDRPLADVLRDASSSFERLLSAVAALPEADLADPHRFAWTGGQPLGPSIVDRSLFGHLHEEHEPGIRAWLATARAAQGEPEPG